MNVLETNDRGEGSGVPAAAVPASPGRLRRIVTEVGVLPLTLAAATVVAAALHAAFFRGAAYTWTRPALILWGVVSSPFFPIFALAIFTLGFVTRFSGEFLRDADEYVRQLRDDPAHRARVRRGALVAAAAAGAALVLVPGYTLADLACVAIFALYLSLRRPARRDWARFVAELLVVVLLFTFVSYSFTVVKALLFRHGAPRDLGLVALEQALFGVAPHRVVAAWASGHPWAIWLADKVYYLLFQHMLLVSIFLVGAGRRAERIEYMGALALCYLAGGYAYHLWPALGPVYADPQAYAYLREWPTLTARFQALLLENTTAASRGDVSVLQTYEYVACMPSLHLAHELVMLWYARRSRAFFGLSLAFSALTAVAVVVLGWHYPIDVLAGGLLAASAIAVSRRFRGVLLPAFVVSEPGPAQSAPVEPEPAVASAPEPASPRRAWLFAGAAAAALSLPFLVVRFAPIADLPQQAAQIRLFLEAIADPASPYRVQWGTPYTVSYLFLGGSWLAFGAQAAGRVAMLAIGLTWVAAALAVVRRRGRPVEAVVLAPLFFLNHATYWGFYSFVCGLPAFVLWFIWLDELPDRAGWRGALRLLGASVLLYACHALWFAAGMLWLVVGTVARRPRRVLLWRLAAVSPVIAAAGAWYLAFRQTSFSTPPLWVTHAERLTPAWLADSMLGGLRGPTEAVVLAAVLAWAAAGLFEHRRTLSRDVDGGLLLAAATFLAVALVAPDKFMNTIEFSRRWVPIAAFLAVLALPAPSLRSGVRALAVLGLAATFSLATASAWRHHERDELAGLESALEALPPRPRVLGLDYVKTSDAIEGRPFLQSFAYAQLLRGGRLNFSFAEFAPSLVVFRQGERPRWTPGLEWYPERVRRSDMTQFDYVLVNALAPEHERLAGLRELRRVTDGERWRLYAVVDPRAEQGSR